MALLSMKLSLVLLLLALAASPALLARAEGGLEGRSLLQSTQNSSSGPKTAVISNVNTNGNRVFCVNVTLPFVNQTHGARGGASPPSQNVTALASEICKDFSRAGRDLYAYFSKGGAQADIAAAAVGAANCTDDAVPNAITVSAVAAQEASKGVDDVEAYFKKVAAAFGDTGIPACITLLESDDAGVKVVKETYYTTD